MSGDRSVPDDHPITWRDRLVTAHRAVVEATETRNAVIGDARKAGLSLRDIGSVVEAAPSTVRIWAGEDDKPTVSLDDPVEP